MTPLTLPPRQKAGRIKPIQIRDDHVLVTLTQGLIAVVDLVDLPVVDGRNWGVARDRCGKIYAKTTITLPDKSRRMLLLHRIICGVDDPRIEVDHQDGDGLNNRRANLRICDRQRNGWNRGLESTSTTGFKGVSYREKYKKYEARIRFNVKRYHLGVFDTAEEAALAYDLAAEVAFGDYALLNFPARYTRARSLRAERPKEPEIRIVVTDRAALFQHFRSNSLLRAILIIKAQHALDAGHDVPGITCEEIRRVA